MMDGLAACVAICLLNGGWALAVAPGEGAESAHPSKQIAARVAHWEIFFEEGIHVEEYARQIDFFKIEIGAVAKNGRIEYISKVAQAKPEKRLGALATDYRWRIGWQKGNLYQADRRLLAKAGISGTDKQLLHFFPIDVQTQLSKLEEAYAQREPATIKRTRFQIRAVTDGQGYEIVVVEQDPPRQADAAQVRSPSLNKPSGR